MKMGVHLRKKLRLFMYKVQQSRLITNIKAKISLKGAIIFLVIMWASTYVGGIVIANVPALEDPWLWGIISFIIITIPGYLVYHKFIVQKTKEV